MGAGTLDPHMGKARRAPPLAWGALEAPLVRGFVGSAVGARRCVGTVVDLLKDGLVPGPCDGSGPAGPGASLRPPFTGASGARRTS
jgi:hypothetical protein